MIVGLLTIEIFIHKSNSLKKKRQILKSLKERLRKNFNISIAEVNNQDKWQRSTLGIAYLGQDKSSVNSLLDRILNFIETIHNVDITDYDMEIL